MRHLAWADPSTTDLTSVPGSCTHLYLMQLQLTGLSCNTDDLLPGVAYSWTYWDHDVDLFTLQMP